MFGAAGKIIRSAGNYDAGAIDGSQVITVTEGFADISATYRGDLNLFGTDYGSSSPGVLDSIGLSNQVTIEGIYAVISGGGDASFFVKILGRFPQDFFTSVTPQGVSALNSSSVTSFGYNFDSFTNRRYTTWFWDYGGPNSSLASQWNGSGTSTASFA